MEHYVLFADDTTVSVAGDTFEDVIGGSCEMQSGVERWFQGNGLVLNQSKTNNIIFSLRKVNEAPFHSVNMTKFLGVHLDSIGVHI